MNSSETDRRNHAPDAFLDCYWGGDRYFRNPQYSRADWNHGGWSDRDDVVHPSLVWFAGWITPVLDVSCYLLALRFLGTRFIKVSILSTFCVSTFYNLWELFPYLLPDLSDYPLAAAVFGGIFVGIGVGLIVRQGGSSGGDDALALSISKVTHWRLSRCYLFTDLVVLGLSISYIPIIHIVFSVVTVTLSSFLIDLVMMYGRDSQKKIINTSRSEQEC